MEDKPSNQNGQSGQGSQSNQNNQSSKPTLTWSQPAVSQKPTAQPTAQPIVTTSTTMPAPVTQSGFKTASIIIGIFALCIVAVWGMVALRHKSEGVVSITGSSALATDADTGKDKNSGGVEDKAIIAANAPVVVSGVLPITVASPQPAGTEVQVSNVSVSVPTWFVVYQDNGGVQGNALGTGLFLPGVDSNTIPLLRATVAGQTYFVGESVDDGDKVFTLHGDPQVKDAQGNVLLTTFQTN
ncbi:MAG: hypothetical protein WCI89_02055 [bacterium]